MSRIGKQLITLPAGVTAATVPNAIEVRGPKGVLTVAYPSLVTVAQAENELTITVANPDNKQEGAYWGLYRSLIANAVEGVSVGFTKQLEINGVGFKVQLKGTTLEINAGFSHVVVFPVPAGITAVVEANKITITGIDKQLVGETAAQIRKIKKPEPYKGKGIKYVDEVIRRKEGKVVKSGE